MTEPKHTAVAETSVPSALKTRRTTGVLRGFHDSPIGRLYCRFEHLIKYCVIGCSGALLDFVLYTLLCSCTGIYYQYINILSASAGIVNNFFLNAMLNFKVRDRLVKRFLIFYAVGCAGIGLTALLLFLLIEKLRLDAVLAKALTIVAVTIVQFVLNKCITFKKGEQRKCRK